MRMKLSLSCERQVLGDKLEVNKRSGQRKRYYRRTSENITNAVDVALFSNDLIQRYCYPFNIHSCISMILQTSASLITCH
jgi:hypothetical protein